MLRPVRSAAANRLIDKFRPARGWEEVSDCAHSRWAVRYPRGWVIDALSARDKAKKQLIRHARVTGAARPLASGD